MARIDLHLFAGPGGWETGMRMAGHTRLMLGIDRDQAACATARAAGHLRIRADVATYPTAPYKNRVDGLIGSPPCPTFSSAGAGAGRHLLAALSTAMTRMMRGHRVMAATRRECTRILRPVALERNGKLTRAERAAWARRNAALSVLSLEPLRWLIAVNPRWVALEQVEAVLPLWQHLAALLRAAGWRAWAGILSAEEYGVPQTRRRAILIARRDGLAVGPPAPTHQAYRHDGRYEVDASLFGPALPPPVSMAAALGEGLPHRPGDGTDSGDAEQFGSAASRAELRQYERQANGGSQPAHAPSLTITASPDNGNLRWAQARNSGPGASREPRSLDAPSYTIRAQGSGSHPSGTEWVLCPGNNSRLGKGRAAPYHRDVAAPSTGLTAQVGSWRVHEVGRARLGDQSRRVTVAEAAALQSFPPDYPWQGTKSQQYQQIGNAVPPLLAAAVTGPFINAEHRATIPPVNEAAGKERKPHTEQETHRG